ncbi:MAG TPA: hypothetical protein VHT97_15525 [Acidimicrobiales bacterium]|jgi:hypothetical protein|nr:hypothetical protein [Acidimicrobiales bacterium]
MLVLQERPPVGDLEPPGRREQPAPSTVSGLGAGSEVDTRPRQARDRSSGATLARPWSGAQQRRLAGINLVTVILMLVAGIGTASGVSGLQAPAAVGRWVGASLGFGSASDATVAKRPTVAQLLPYGKGMWIWEPDQTEGGDAAAIVARAKAIGLTHLYVRTGSSWDGFNGGPFLDKLLPAAHQAGLLVYGWDFPRLLSPSDDVARAKEAVQHRAPGKQHIDGFAADIETQSEGTAISGPAATQYGQELRAAVGPDFPLIATVPRPSPSLSYPYAEVVASFDAIAPMVYWLNRQPDSDVAGALHDLAPYGKPIFPVGQAYDGKPEGGRPGVPPPEELWRFMRFAQSNGALGVSFWSWQGADQRAFDAIGQAEEFPPAAALALR